MIYGAEPYSYFVPFQIDLDAALQQLRESEFHAGRYFPAMPFPDDASKVTVGAKHASIDNARMDAAEEGTHSILDLDRVADEPDFCVASPVSKESLRSFTVRRSQRVSRLGRTKTS